jgi:hypothetical protein
MYAHNHAAAVLNLTLEKVIADLPRDAGSIVVISLLLGFIYLIWYGSRKTVVERFSATSELDPDPGAGAGVSPIEEAGNTGSGAAGDAPPMAGPAWRHAEGRSA